MFFRGARFRLRDLGWQNGYGMKKTSLGIRRELLRTLDPPPLREDCFQFLKRKLVPGYGDPPLDLSQGDDGEAGHSSAPFPHRP